LVFGGLLGVVYVHYSLTTKILHSCGWCKRLVVFLSGIGSDPERRVALKLPRLKEVREGRGWSQKKLAEESGVSRDSISNYETGHREAWPATAKKLADALDVEIADLREPTRELVVAGKAEAPPPGPPQVTREELAAQGIPATDPEVEELNYTIADLWRLVAGGAKPRAFFRHEDVDKTRVWMLMDLILETPNIVTPEDAGIVRQGMRERLKA
jgi:putative transcriptional regulator